MTLPLATALLQALKDHGAREIFGIPGDFALPFFRFVERDNVLPLYTLSHEPGVGFAADAAARVHGSGSLGVAAVTYGAGALNLVNACAGAHAERSPLVVISGAPGKAEWASGLSLHHQLRSLDSQRRVFQEVTCDQGVLDDPATAPEIIARVLDNARRQSLPVYLEVPRDMVGAPVAAVQPVAPPAGDPDVLAECVEEIGERIARARSPVILAGVEVRRYGLEAAVADLARRFNIPLVTSFLARGLFAEEDAPLVGAYLGAAGDPRISGLVEESDAPLLLGVILSDTNFALSAQRLKANRFVQALGGQVRVGHHVYPDLPLGDLVAALRQLPLHRTEAAVEPSVAVDYRRDLPRDDEPVLPGDIACAINDLMARHGRMPMVSDIGDCLFTAMEIENTRLAAPGYYAGMGFGVPGGLGVQVATGERPIVLVGDGAFQMTGWELGNCARQGWDPIVVVFNNASWEMLRTFEADAAFNDLDAWRFADLADALGGRGRRVATRRELAEALEAAVAETGRFQLVEVMLPRGVTSDTLRRFSEGVKARQRG